MAERYKLEEQFAKIEDRWDRRPEDPMENVFTAWCIREYFLPEMAPGRGREIFEWFATDLEDCARAQMEKRWEASPPPPRQGDDAAIREQPRSS